MSAQTTRNHLCWIDAFYEVTKDLDVPDLYRMWTAVSIIGGTLERNCWDRTHKGKYYPNLYVLLVGNPATGKSLIIDKARDYWLSLGSKFRIGPDDLSKASLLDYMAINTQGEGNNAHSAAIFASSEFGNLVPEHDRTWLNTLNKFFDCPSHPHVERKRGHGELRIQNVFLHILGGTQAKYLSALLPDEAWGMGFMTRVVMVYGEKAKEFADFYKDIPEGSDEISPTLVQDLRQIRLMRGEFTVSAEAKEEINKAAREGFPPIPQHTKLQAFNDRRAIIIAKVTMIFSAAESNDRVILPHHFKKAYHLMKATEAVMPQIFRDMTQGSHGEIIDEVFMYISDRYALKGDPVPKPHLIQYLKNKIPHNQIDYLLQTMENAQMIILERKLVGKKYIEGYRPDPNATIGLTE